MEDIEIKTDGDPQKSHKKGWLKSFIEPLREKYKKLEPVVCPYVNDLVHFNSSGFNHLIWKSEMGMRSGSVIRDRFLALDVVSEILSKSGTLQEYENENKEFLCFIAIIDGNKYKVVITKTGDGKYKFVSVIPKWKTGKRDELLVAK
jgi:hypothetical protein